MSETPKPDPVLSPLEQAIKKRGRRLYTFPVQDIFGLDDEPIHQISFRPAVLAEEHRALEVAHELIEQNTQKAKALRDNEKYVVDFETLSLLHTVCRKAEEPEYNAFITVEWMRENVTPERAAVLLRLYHEARAEESPEREFTLDQLHAVVDLVTTHPDPTYLLSNCSREWLTQGFAMLAQKTTQLEARVAKLLEVKGGVEVATEDEAT